MSFFLSTTNRTNEANLIVGINERWRSTNASELGKDTQHIDDDRFVSFAERLRSLSCLACSHPFHLLFNNILLRAVL